MHKFLNSLELNFEISGTVVYPCDVCIEEFDLSIEGSEQVQVKIVSEIPSENEEHVVYMLEGKSSISVADMLYELVMLSIPMRTVHSDDKEGNPTCDPSILKYLQDSEDNLAADEEADDVDKTNPIWDALKNLK